MYDLSFLIKIFKPRTQKHIYAHIHIQYAIFLIFIKTYNFEFVFLLCFNFSLFIPVTSFITTRPDRLSEQWGRRQPQRSPSNPTPLQSLGTKATKHASVNISVASAPHPGSCCSLSAGPQSEPLCVPWQTALCCAAGHGWPVVERQRCLHACSSSGED